MFSQAGLVAARFFLLSQPTATPYNPYVMGVLAYIINILYTVYAWVAYAPQAIAGVALGAALYSA